MTAQVEVVRVDALRKQYGDQVAVEEVSFSAHSGEVFGLLGPNGAGKSTTLGCINGLLQPTEGKVQVMGHDVVREPVDARRRLGVVPQELALYEDLSARENLAYWAAAYGLHGVEQKRRVDEVLEQVGLADRDREPAQRFGGGMKRRLNIGCGMVHAPKVLLLDEPTVGVDPQSRVRILELVREQVQAGTCVIYTTHYMEEAETLCDRLAVMDHGRIIAGGTLTELRSIMGEKDLLRLTGSFADIDPSTALQSLDGVEVVHADDSSLRLALASASSRLPEIFQTLTTAGAEVRETTLTQPSLESLFIKLTGKELRE